MQRQSVDDVMYRVLFFLLGRVKSTSLLANADHHRQASMLWLNMGLYISLFSSYCHSDDSLYWYTALSKYKHTPPQARFFTRPRLHKHTSIQAQFNTSKKYQ